MISSKDGFAYIYMYLIINPTNDPQKKLECLTPHDLLLETEMRSVKDSIAHQPMDIQIINNIIF